MQRKRQSAQGQHPHAVSSQKSVVSPERLNNFQHASRSEPGHNFRVLVLAASPRQSLCTCGPGEHSANFGRWPGQLLAAKKDLSCVR